MRRSSLPQANAAVAAAAAAALAASTAAAAILPPRCAAAQRDSARTGAGLTRAAAIRERSRSSASSPLAISRRNARPAAFRTVAVAVPVLIWSLYFLASFLTRGVTWSTELWTGIIVWAGISGLGLSVVMNPPAVPNLSDVSRAGAGASGA